MRRNGVTMSGGGNAITLTSNRFSRVRVSVPGIESQIIPAASRSNWHPAVTLPPLPPGAVITCVPETEGPRGPRPLQDGPFEPDNDRAFQFHIIEE